MSKTEEFISKAKSIHGNKYDYSKVDYINSQTKVCIICPEHGEFWQTPIHHINRKQGCPSCYGNKKLTTEEFISKAEAVHGNKYDYSKVEYKNANTRVCIICPAHGEFWQTSHDHLSGKGCSKCGGTCKLTTEEFISKAKSIHGNKYDYSKVDYINIDVPVCIICPVHGEFWQTPNNHLTKYQGCPSCYGNKKLTTEEFISKAKSIHGNKYDYSKVDYINNKTRVCIICPKHGEFWQTPDSHINRGYGCPLCKESQGEKRIRVWLENNNFKKNEDYIIGYRSSWLGKQHLDFFLPKINVGIEYDGLQHFRLAKFGGMYFFKAVKQFIMVKRHDIKKNILCKKNDIKLVRIPYTEYNNIEQILHDQLCDYEMMIIEVKK